LEQTFGGANTLVKATLKVDLNDVTGEGTQVSAGICGVDTDALVLALDLAHVDVLVGDLLCYEVASPNAESVVVDGHKLVVSSVEESNFVSDVHADGVAANSFAGFNLPNNKLIVVLSSEGRKVLLIAGERQALDIDLMELQSVQFLQSVEVPNDNLSLEARVSLLT